MFGWKNKKDAQTTVDLRRKVAFAEIEDQLRATKGNVGEEMGERLFNLAQAARLGDPHPELDEAVRGIRRLRK